MLASFLAVSLIPCGLTVNAVVQVLFADALAEVISMVVVSLCSVIMVSLPLWICCL